ncbi:hypothetical protein [Aeromicrobium sp. UC242_57]|uniref:hypothetical protein n=1 Tax=Aeromicrobium sp. UC242_57 TaxID=3374624 RepID=UPI0037A0FDDE
MYITRYDDVFRVARNDEPFSSSRASMGGREGTAIVIPSGPGLDDFQFPLESIRRTRSSTATCSTRCSPSARSRR